MPFASLVGRVKPDCVRVLINREPVGPFREDENDREERGTRPSDGLFFCWSHVLPDVLMLGDCDDQCQKLVELIGWSEDYERIKMEGRKKMQNQ